MLLNNVLVFFKGNAPIKEYIVLTCIHKKHNGVLYRCIRQPCPKRWPVSLDD